MGARFVGCDREQVVLLAPSLRDWVPEGHLVWTVLDAVGELDLSAVDADYRADGRRHERPLGEVFCGVLGLCARAGLVSVGVVAIDGTKMAANASSDANREFGQIAREILAEAAEIDAREDEVYGDRRGDELPEQLRTREGRRQPLGEAEERLARERGQPLATPPEDERPVTVELDPAEFVTRPQAAARGCAKGAAR